MKEYQYSPLHEPYKLKSVIKECKGNDPGCLKTFVARNKKEDLCLKCRSTEREEVQQVIIPKLEGDKEPRLGYGLTEVIVYCKHCGEGVTRRLSNRSAVCYKCRVTRNKANAKRRYRNEKN